MPEHMTSFLSLYQVSGSKGTSNEYSLWKIEIENIFEGSESENCEYSSLL